LETGGEDDARPAHAAAGVPEDVGVFAARAVQHRAIAAHQVEGNQPVGEATFGRVVLAVYVAGDAAAHRDEARAGRDVREPAERHHRVQQIAQQQPGLTVHDARVRVEGAQAVHFQRRNDVWGEGRVAVAASVAASDEPLAGGDVVAHLITVVG